jgi:carboxypeptidase Taq
MNSVPASAPASTAARSAYDRLVERFREQHLLDGAASILSWDRETMMPGGGVAFRGEQLALLASLSHRIATDPELGDLLEAADAETADADEGDPRRVNVREWRRDRDRNLKLPEALVKELAEVASTAQHEWAEARKANDYARFKPWLGKLVDLNRRKAECLGWAEGGEPWDALGDLYEPGPTRSSSASRTSSPGSPTPRRVPTTRSIVSSSRRPSRRRSCGSWRSSSASTSTAVASTPRRIPSAGGRTATTCGSPPASTRI